MKTHTCLLVVLTLGMVGCGPRKPSAPEPMGDSALRALLGVKGLGGKFTLPRGEDYFALGTYSYENGKLTNQSWSIGGSVKGLPHRTVPAQLLWGEVQGRPTTLLTSGNATTWGKDPFWTNVGFVMTKLSPDDTPEMTTDGSRVLGFAGSSLSQDGKEQPMGSSTLEGTLKHRKYVGALVLRSFKTEAEMEALMHEHAKGLTGESK